MVCKHCGSQKTRVVRTEKYEQFVRRVRLCLNCGRTFDTDEMVVK